MKKYLLAYSFCVSQMLFAETTDYKKQDSVTISSAYFEGQYTNEQLAVFGLELLRGLDRIEKYALSNIDPDNSVGTISTRVLTRLVGYGMYYIFNTAYHETGHGLRVKAFGYDYDLMTDHKSIAPFKKNENFFQYLFKKKKRAACSPGPGSEKLTDKERLIFSAGGMNNEMYFAERLSEELHDKEGLGVVESIAYLHSRISPASYASKKKDKEDADKLNTQVGDDPIAVQGYYEKMGISANKSHIKKAGIISTFLSGTTYSILYGAYKCFSSGNYYRAEPFNISGFRIPDTFSYVTSRGVSYKVVSGYKMRDDMNFIFGFESVFHGKSSNEFTVGIEKRFESLLNASCKLVSTIGNGFNLETQCSIPFSKFLSFNFGGGSYSCNSLLGERHAKNMKNDKKRSNNLFVSMSYKY